VAGLFYVAIENAREERTAKIESLIETIGDPNTSLDDRIYASYDIARYPEARDSLVELLCSIDIVPMDSPDELVDIAACAAMALYLMDDGNDFMLLLVKDSALPMSTRFVAAWVVGIFNPGEHLAPMLSEFMDNGTIEVRYSAAVIALDCGISSMIEPARDMRGEIIETLTNDSDPQHRYYALSALGTLGEENLPLIIDATTDENEYVRAEACYCLGEIGNQSALEALGRALSDSDESVRKNAQEAIDKISTA